MKSKNKRDKYFARLKIDVVGWLTAIRQQNKAIRRKNKLIKRLRAEIQQLLDEGFTK